MSDQSEQIAAVVAVVEAYAAAVGAGDRAALEPLFHPSARMYGRMGQRLLDQPIGEFLEHVAGSPSPQTRGDAYAAVVRQVQVTGATAVVSLDEVGYQGRDFNDQFVLCRSAEGWVIVTKAFAIAG